MRVRVELGLQQWQRNSKISSSLFPFPHLPLVLLLPLRRCPAPTPFSFSHCSATLPPHHSPSPTTALPYPHTVLLLPLRHCPAPTPFSRHCMATRSPATPTPHGRSFSRYPHNVLLLPHIAQPHQISDWQPPYLDRHLPLVCIFDQQPPSSSPTRPHLRSAVTNAMSILISDRQWPALPPLLISNRQWQRQQPRPSSSPIGSDQCSRLSSSPIGSDQLPSSSLISQRPGPFIDIVSGIDVSQAPSGDPSSPSSCIDFECMILVTVIF